MIFLLYIFMYFCIENINDIFGEEITKTTVKKILEEDLEICVNFPKIEYLNNTPTIVFLSCYSTNYNNSELLLKKTLRFDFLFFDDISKKGTKTTITIKSFSEKLHFFIKQNEYLTHAHNMMQYDSFFIEFKVKEQDNKFKNLRTPYFTIESFNRNNVIKKNPGIHKLSLQDNIYNEQNYNKISTFPWGGLGKVSMILVIILLVIGLLILLLRNHMENKIHHKRFAKFNDEIRRIAQEKKINHSKVLSS